MEQPAGTPVLAVDLGGTQIRSALVTPDLTVHCRRAVPTHDEEGVDAVISRIGDVAAAVLAEAEAGGLRRPVGVGISSPGPIDPWRGVVVAPPNLAGWRDVPLAAAISSRLDLPTFLERDTNVAMMAEWRHGAARGARTAIYVTVSTGIGGAAVIDRHPLIGVDGTAGEVGHITVELDGPECGCGARGHVEAIASGTALAREARALLDRGEAPILERLAADGAEVDAALLSSAADAGDQACRAVLEHAWVAVGAMCAGLVNLLNPEVIVLGGSIAEHRPRLLDVAREEIDRRAFETPARRVRLELPQHGGDVSLIGALPTVHERLGDPEFHPQQGASVT